MASLGLSMEICVFLLFLSISLYESVFTNLVIYRTCYVSFGFNESECAKLGTENLDSNATELEKIVQPYANVISMTKSFVETFLGVFICLFIGPWSDKKGRKPVLLSSMAGATLSMLIIAIVASIPNASPWYLVLPLIGTFFGGFSSFLTVVTCYISDLASDENRGTRMGMMEASLTLGSLVGTTTSSYIFSAVGYPWHFGICTACIFMGFLYILFFVEESLTDTTAQANLFSLTNVKAIFQTILRRRDHYNRISLICLTVISAMFILSITESGVTFLYLRAEFGWSLQKYTLYCSATSVIWIAGTWLTVYVLHKRLAVAETVLLLIGLISMLDGSMLTGLALNDWYIYAAGIVRLCGAAITPMVRTLVSKIVDADEAGKAFTLIVALEILGATIAIPLYTFTYNSTLNYMPGAYNFLSAGVHVVGIIIAIIVALLRHRQRYHSNRYGPLVVPDESE